MDKAKTISKDYADKNTCYNPDSDLQYRATRKAVEYGFHQALQVAVEWFSERFDKKGSLDPNDIEDFSNHIKGKQLVKPDNNPISKVRQEQVKVDRPIKRGKHQFELHSLPPLRKDLKDDYNWCLENLPLKEDKGIVYNVTEVYIITSSQKIIDKVNKHFGSNFDFNNFFPNHIYYI